MKFEWDEEKAASNPSNRPSPQKNLQKLTSATRMRAFPLSRIFKE